MPNYNGYGYGVAWIAFNDDPLCKNVEQVAGYISTLLLADLHNKEPRKVAGDIVSMRRGSPPTRLYKVYKRFYGASNGS